MVPAESYAHLQLCFPRDAAMSEVELRQFLADHGFSVANLSYACTAQSRWFEYQMVIRSRDSKSARRLAESLRNSDKVEQFRMAPAGD
jgi:putative Mg2+ transporter-C (MgtC) family protein